MTIHIALAVILFAAAVAPQTKGAKSAAELVEALRSTDARTKAGAARAISDRTDLHTDPIVKAAVLTELRQANELMKLRYHTQSKIGSSDDFEYADVYLGLVQAAQRFDGEGVLAALIPTVGSSASSRERLASIGEQAIQPLITAYDEPTGMTDFGSQRLAILDTLSLIALRSEVPSAARVRLRSLAARALRSKEPPEVGGGMLLGAALRDPELIAEIRELRAAKFPAVKSTRSANYLEAIAKKAFTRAGVR